MNTPSDPPAPPPRVPPPAIGTALYVHVPFCVHKCGYCDFFSRPVDGEDVEGWVETLLREASLRAPQQPRTVFLGGGTPSLLEIDQLAHLFDALDEITSFRGSACEVSVECNPESLSGEKARALRELGVTRLSVGVQSLRDDLLRFFDRPHRAHEGEAALQVALSQGFTSVSADMIYAVPGQALASWREDLGQLAQTGVQHVSAYGLTFEEGTPLHARLARGELNRLPEDEDLEFFRLTRSRLREVGLDPYEVSNYSTSNHQCLHNINYWRNGEYVGLGPSAASRLGAIRFGNARSIKQWGEAVRSGGQIPAWTDPLSPIRRLGETWWLGLRMSEGVDPAAARSTSGLGEPGSLNRGTDLDEHPDPAESLAEQLAGGGWLERRQTRWCLSERGLPVADAVAARFLAACVDEAPRGAHNSECDT